MEARIKFTKPKFYYDKKKKKTQPSFYEIVAVMTVDRTTIANTERGAQLLWTVGEFRLHQYTVLYSPAKRTVIFTSHLFTHCGLQNYAACG